MTLLALGAGRSAYADCRVIDQLDQLYALQSRLARGPDTLLFSSDIRQLRRMSRELSGPAILNAVDANGFSRKGRAFSQFLQDTKMLVQKVSLDDAHSAMPHFSANVRDNLNAIGGYLTDLRCSSEQIAVDKAAAERRTATNASDAEDLERFYQSLSTIANEVFHPRTFLILLAAAAAKFITLPILKRWLLLRFRQSRRHPVSFETQYQLDEQIVSAMLLDINCYGTKLRHESEDPHSKGTRLEIAIFDDWISGTVKWSNTHYSGVQFKKTLSLDTVAAICKQSEEQNPRPTNAKRRPKGRRFAN